VTERRGILRPWALSTIAFGDLVTGRAGDVSVEHRDVVGVDAQQL
jgi:hypothetical protein